MSEMVDAGLVVELEAAQRRHNERQTEWIVREEAASEARVCAWCWTSLAGRRESTRYCKPEHRTAAWKHRQGLGPPPPVRDAENGAERPAWRVRDAERKRERRAAGEVLPCDVRVQWWRAVEALTVYFVAGPVERPMPEEQARARATRVLASALPERLRPQAREVVSE